MGKFPMDTRLELLEECAFDYDVYGVEHVRPFDERCYYVNLGNNGDFAVVTDRGVVIDQRITNTDHADSVYDLVDNKLLELTPTARQIYYSQFLSKENK